MYYGCPYSLTSIYFSATNDLMKANNRRGFSDHAATDDQTMNGLRILAQIVARAYLTSNGHVGKEDKTKDTLKDSSRDENIP